jgi:hypothetical protein
MAKFVSADALITALQGLGKPTEVFVSISNGATLLAGDNPARPAFAFDFISETFASETGKAAPTPWVQAIAAPEPTLLHGRTTGVYSVDIKGSRRSFGSMKQLLKETILQLSQGDETFLQRLSNEKSRTRRIVARRPEELFSKPHLVKAHAEELIPGWWLNTNNSAEQVKKWIFVAARIANLTLNRDIRLSF